MTRLLHPRDIRQFTIAEISARLSSLAIVDTRLLHVLERDPRRGVQRLAAQFRSRQAREAREALRLQDLLRLEREQRAQGFEVIAGVDEAGVAPLAGPVVAAAVILPPDARLPALDDSKRLTPRERDLLFEEITRVAVASHIGIATVQEIDRLNILQAMRLAHRRAILGLPVRPHLVLIDGRYPADVPVTQLVVVNADATCASVAAASIIAKVTRDRMMEEVARRYPQYGFARNKGYGTRGHLEAIRRFGPTPVHRRSFFPVRGQQEALSIG